MSPDRPACVGTEDTRETETENDRGRTSETRPEGPVDRQGVWGPDKGKVVETTGGTRKGL